MVNDSGYFHADERGTVDMGRDLSVNSAGHYRLLSRPVFETIRPAGRVDYQLLYVAKGSLLFELDGASVSVGDGMVVLYGPNAPQRYRYRLEDQPDVYWVHFTGSEAGERLAEAGFPRNGAYHVGPQSEFALLVQKMIQELQVKRNRHHELCNLYFKELLELLARHAEEVRVDWQRDALVEKAIVDFHQAYHLPICIEDYVRALGISACWFIRCFKRYTGKTPLQYITAIRMDKSKELLCSSSFNCSEIAHAVGYQDPLYFSRAFRQSTGIAPQAYRTTMRQAADRRGAPDGTAWAE